MRVRVTETERLIMLADDLGWPIIKEDYDWNDVLVQDGREYVYWKHQNGNVIYASDNLGPLSKPFKLAERLGERGGEIARRAGLTDEKK